MKTKTPYKHLYFDIYEACIAAQLLQAWLATWNRTTPSNLIIDPEQKVAKVVTEDNGETIGHEPVETWTDRTTDHYTLRYYFFWEHNLGELDKTWMTRQED